MTSFNGSVHTTFNTRHELHPEDIKTIGDIDIYRFANPIKGSILSRYKTMVNLYGENNADRMMRELEVRSW